MFSAKLLRPYPRRRLLLALSVRLAAAIAATAGLMIVAAPASAAQPVSFTPAPGSPFAVGTTPFGITRADFNSDGKPDLAVANFSSNNVTVLLGNGSGGFAPAPGSPFPVGSGPREITSADFNGDGKIDLAVTNNGSNNVTVLLGNGSGGFAPAPGSPFAVGTNPFAITSADFNGDQKPDLAVANAGSNNVTVLLGNGSGGFAPATGSPFAVGTTPGGITSADFDGDGKIDLAVANFLSNNVTVLLGNGSGGFTQATGSPFAVGSGPNGITSADFDGDGKIDLAVTNFSSNNVTVLLGNGSGGFAPAPGSPFPVGTNPFAITSADFNGDQKPDLAVANARSNNVTVLLNTTPSLTPPPGTNPPPPGTNPPPPGTNSPPPGTPSCVPAQAKHHGHKGHKKGGSTTNCSKTKKHHRHHH